MTNKNIVKLVNLSDLTLTKDQIQVLSKGLKFCPTPGAPDPGVSQGGYGQASLQDTPDCILPW